MRIDQLDLIRYGKFTHQSVALPRAQRDFHVIVGPNEAGKSTLRSAIHHLLYGFPLRNPGYAFLHPLPDLRLGAHLSHGERQLAFQRVKANKASLRGPDDAPLPDEALAPFLGGVDPKFFEQMFSLDHERLVQGGASILSAADEDVGQVLFESAAGIASLGDIRAALEQEADGLWGKRKSSARVYYQAEQDYEEARQALKAASLRAKDWAEAHTRVEELDTQRKAALAEHATLKARHALLQRARRVAPLLAALDLQTARLAEHVGAPDLPEGASAALDEAERRLAAIELVRAHQGRLQEAARQALQTLHADTRLLEQEEQITALDELRLQYRAHAADIEKREREASSRWAVIAELAGQLGWDAGSEQDLAARIPSPSSRTALARLARQGPALAQAREAAERALRLKQRELDHARRELEGLAQAQVAPTLRTAMARARALGDPAAMLRDLQSEVDGKELGLGVAQMALLGEAMDMQALAAMLPPSREHVQGLLEAHRRDEAEADRLDQEMRKAAAQMLQLGADARRIREQLHPVLLEDLHRARRERDELWGLLQRDPSTLPAQAERYEHLVARSDALADQRHDRAHDAAQLQNLEDRKASLRLEQESLQRQVEALRARREQREAQWVALREECRLPALSIPAASEWIQARERVLQAWQDLCAARQRLDAYGEDLSRAASALAAQLDAAGLQAGDADLTVLLTQAEEWVRQLDETRGERKSLEQQRDATTRELEALGDAAAAAEEAYLAWRADWQQALAAAGFPAEDEPLAVEARLEAMGRIGEALASLRQIRIERIDPMRADLRDLEARARALALALRPGLADRSAAELILELRRELGEARATQTRIEQARAELAAADEALARASLEEQGLRSSLAPLLRRAEAQDLVQLRAAIERSDARRRLQALVEDMHRTLLEQGDGLSLEELRAQLRGLDPGAVLDELAGLELREDAVVRRMQELSAAHSSAEAAFRAMAGQADAATAEAKRQESLARMSDAVERFIKVRTAARLLGWSIERYRDARQGPMLAAASAIFSRLTLGSFDRLVVDFDSQPPTLHGRRPQGGSVGVEGMSEGTRDQLYLALRLAALDMHLARAHALPFVADDLFINFDDQRSKAGLEALSALSQRTQVLFLTHHDHILDLVREVYGDSVNVVRLAPPSGTALATEQP